MSGERVVVRVRFHFCGHIEDIPASPHSSLAAGGTGGDAPVWCTACEHLRYPNTKRVL